MIAETTHQATQRNMPEYMNSLQNSNSNNRIQNIITHFFYLWRNSPTRTQVASFLNSRSRTHTHTHTSGGAPPGRVINSPQRPLRTQHAANVTDEHPCTQRDSNPRSQQSSGCVSTVQIALPLGPANYVLQFDVCFVFVAVLVVITNTMKFLLIN